MLPLEFQSLAVRLAAVIAPPLLLLLFVATETSSQLDVDAWWGGEAEALGNLDEIELVYVEDRAKGMRGICLKVGAVTFFGGLDWSYVSMSFVYLTGVGGQKRNSPCSDSSFGQ
jgi:hypothetical protein